jgi:hypothetical protein
MAKSALVRVARRRKRRPLNRLIGPVPVSLGIPTASLAGKTCLVVLLDAHNPSDAVVVAAW